MRGQNTHPEIRQRASALLQHPELEAQGQREAGEREALNHERQVQVERGRGAKRQRKREVEVQLQFATTQPSDSASRD